MARNKDIPRIANPPSGDGHLVTHRYMTATELAERDARQKSYDDMLSRQQAYEDRRTQQHQKDKGPTAGCVFTKSCALPNGVIDYTNPSGFIPTSGISDYGNFTLLGGRDADAEGLTPLKKISGSKLPSSVTNLALGGIAVGAATASCAGLCAAGGTIAGAGATTTAAASSTGALTAGAVSGGLMGIVALLWPSNLADSSLYTEEQLQSLKEGRTRVRLHVEQQADGTLKGYGYNTQKRRDWEMIPVVQFTAQGTQQVADLGDGVTLIWTPSHDPTSVTGIPPLEVAPQAPQIWIYPPTEQADNIIINPIYPPEYQDFILVFPADSGVPPLYVVMNVRKIPGTASGHGEDTPGIWLIGAGSGMGVPIPTQVADALRGRNFKSFDTFRSALWEAVSASSAADQFIPQNVDRMRTGRAPRVRKADRAGGRLSYELHHLEKVSEGGGVYDIDNLRVNTPKNHIDIHRNE